MAVVKHFYVHLACHEILQGIRTIGANGISRRPLNIHSANEQVLHTTIPGLDPTSSHRCPDTFYALFPRIYFGPFQSLLFLFQ